MPPSWLAQLPEPQARVLASFLEKYLKDDPLVAQPRPQSLVLERSASGQIMLTVTRAGSRAKVIKWSPTTELVVAEGGLGHERTQDHTGRVSTRESKGKVMAGRFSGELGMEGTAAFAEAIFIWINPDGTTKAIQFASSALSAKLAVELEAEVSKTSWFESDFSLGVSFDIFKIGGCVLYRGEPDPESENDKRDQVEVSLCGEGGAGLGASVNLEFDPKTRPKLKGTVKMLVGVGGAVTSSASFENLPGPQTARDRINSEALSGTLKVREPRRIPVPPTSEPPLHQPRLAHERPTTTVAEALSVPGFVNVPVKLERQRENGFSVAVSGGQKSIVKHGLWRLPVEVSERRHSDAAPALTEGLRLILEEQGGGRKAISLDASCRTAHGWRAVFPDIHPGKAYSLILEDSVTGSRDPLLDQVGGPELLRLIELDPEPGSFELTSRAEPLGTEHLREQPAACHFMEVTTGRVAPPRELVDELGPAWLYVFWIEHEAVRLRCEGSLKSGVLSLVNWRTRTWGPRDLRQPTKQVASLTFPLGADGLYHEGLFVGIFRPQLKMADINRLLSTPALIRERCRPLNRRGGVVQLFEPSLTVLHTLLVGS